MTNDFKMMQISLKEQTWGLEDSEIRFDFIRMTSEICLELRRLKTILREDNCERLNLWGEETK